MSLEFFEELKNILANGTNYEIECATKAILDFMKQKIINTTDYKLELFIKDFLKTKQKVIK
jgi:hypothetical protein